MQPQFLLVLQRFTSRLPSCNTHALPSRTTSPLFSICATAITSHQGGLVLQTLRAPIYLPRANTDPVSSPHAALAVFSLALRRPLCEEVLVLMLDNQLRGVGLMSFDAVSSFANNVNHAIGLCSSVLDASSLSICTVEPQLLSRDNDSKYLEMAQDLCRHAGLNFIDWLVVTRGAVINIRAVS